MIPCTYRTALSLLIATALAQNNTAGPVVDLRYVKYQGQYLPEYEVVDFRGIRYAQTPTGDLRWRSPRPIETSGQYDPMQVIDATAQGPICVQAGPPIPVDTSGAEDEDCLLVDIQVPATPVSSSLPVMVEFHGGGYILGSVNTAPGYAMVQHSRGNIIYVNVQYRLGVYGFLGSADVRDNGVANAGLLDQREALNWVQRNIRAFGGDPNRVTVHGGSAGGSSIINHLIMYGGETALPFQAAIAEYAWMQTYKNNTILERQYSDLLRVANCSDLLCLRSADNHTLSTATKQLYKIAPMRYGGPGDLYFTPYIDGHIIQDLPSTEFKRGAFHSVPLLTNRAAFEGLAFSNRNLTTTPASVQTDLQAVFPFAKPNFFNRLFQLYPSAAFNSSFFHRQTIYGDYIINYPSYYFASAMADYGAPTYKMIFNAGTQIHAATAAYLVTKSEVADDPRLAKMMKDWFVSFVVRHDPNAVSFTDVDKPVWPLYTEAGNLGESSGFSVLEVNYTNIEVRPDADASGRCDFMHSQSYVVRN